MVLFSAFKNVIKVLKVRGGTFAGLKIKRWDFRRSYKSLKTAVVIRPDWQNFFTVVSTPVEVGTADSSPDVAISV